MDRLKRDYPWIKTPLVIGAPMRLIALADLAVSISTAGGIGFIGAGTDTSDLEAHLANASTLFTKSPSLPTRSPTTLPIGIGFINWGASLPAAISAISKYRPAAVWFFAPSSLSSLCEWRDAVKSASPDTKIWVQIGSVKEAVGIVKAIEPDVLVVQGTDAGGHGLSQGAGLISLFPEVSDAIDAIDGIATPPSLVAAGGITEARSAASGFTLGAAGVVMGTRFLAAREANVSLGYQRAVLDAEDGGQTTVRTKVYDYLRGTTGWAETHNARGVVNKSYLDYLEGVDQVVNKRLYEDEMGKGDEGWGVGGRMTTYAGSGVGLVREVKSAGEIVDEVREGVRGVLERATRLAGVGAL